MDEIIESATLENLNEILSDESIAELEGKILDSSMETRIGTTLDILRSEYELDYDNLVINGDYLEKVPNTIARNYLLERFIDVGNGLQESNRTFQDATMNSVCEDYLSIADILSVDLDAYCKNKGYSVDESDFDEIEKHLCSISSLIRYCWNMMDMVSSLPPNEFKNTCYRISEKCASIINMSTYGKSNPELESILKALSSMVDRIMVDRKLDNMQKARNERYKESKMRTFRYLSRRVEEITAEINACDPMDMTQRANLTRTLEQVQYFLRSFNKDR